MVRLLGDPECRGSLGLGSSRVGFVRGSWVHGVQVGFMGVRRGWVF